MRYHSAFKNSTFDTSTFIAATKIQKSDEDGLISVELSAIICRISSPIRNQSWVTNWYCNYDHWLFEIWSIKIHGFQPKARNRLKAAHTVISEDHFRAICIARYQDSEKYEKSYLF
jgi:hypothetical protein